jgi:hypothetical protein
VAAKEGEPACEVCGAALRVHAKGVSYPCGHHESPMARAWKKDEEHPRWSQAAVAKEPGHGAAARTNEAGEILYCEDCSSPQFESPGGETCANGHGGAAGLTAADLRKRERVVKTRAGAEPRERLAPEGALAGQSVTVVWGKELYSPRQFHTYEVGPFTATTAVLPGETIAGAAARAMGDLRQFAEQERERKRADYERSAGINR